MSSQFYVDENKPWFKPEAGWPDQVSKNYEFPEITLHEMFSEAARKFGQSRVMWFLDTYMTFAEMERHVNSLATALHNLGIRKGDVVALVLPNSFQYVISYYACARIGAIVTGVNPTYKPGEVLHQFRVTGVKSVIVLDALYQSLMEPMFFVFREHPEQGRIQGGLPVVLCTLLARGRLFEATSEFLDAVESRLLSLPNFDQQTPKEVDAFEQQVQYPTGRIDPPHPQAVHEIFHDMAEPGHGIDPGHAGQTLDGVGCTKRLVETVRIDTAAALDGLIQTHQNPSEILDEFLGLGNEFLKTSTALVDHGQTPPPYLPRDMCRRHKATRSSGSKGLVR